MDTANSSDRKPYRVAIVGAGFSGTLVAAHLLRRSKQPLTVYLIERDPHQFGRGVAYSTAQDCHLLNVPAANMSAFPDQPGHFLEWAKAHVQTGPWVGEIEATSFLPRRLYGTYLTGLLGQAEAMAQPSVKLQRIRQKATAISVSPEVDAVEIRLSNGTCLQADKVVLALGNFPPANPAIADTGFYRSPRYHRNPWLPGVLESVMETQACLLLGSGLTMVDWVIMLSEAGYRGIIHVVSRRGLWPQTHRLAPPAAFSLELSESPRVREWLRTVRAYLRQSDGDWRTVVDALRPHIPALWQALSLTERRRFLRHLRPYWDLHRHRLAPVVAAHLQKLLDSGRVVRHAGTVQSYRETADFVEASIRPRGLRPRELLPIEAVINCSGSESNYRRLESGFVRNLLEQGAIVPDALNLGLEADTSGALVGRDGKASKVLFTLGPPKKGMLWETTAMPELRQQAAQLAEVLLADAHHFSNSGGNHA